MPQPGGINYCWISWLCGMLLVQCVEELYATDLSLSVFQS